MGNSHEKIDIIHRILRCHKAGTTHTEPEMLRNPVSHYADLSEELLAKKARYWGQLQLSTHGIWRRLNHC